MVFSEELRAGRFPVALEITPPQRERLSVLLRRAKLLGDRASAINVIQRPDRQASLEASLQLLAAEIDPAWHLVTRGRTAEAIAGDLSRAREGGIGTVLVILGDHEASAAPGGPTIREVTAMARDEMPGALIGATFNQYGRDQAAAFRNLLPKLWAGASYVQMQPVFDLDLFEAAAMRIRQEAPDARIVPMAMPLPTMEAADRISARLGVSIPEWVRAPGDPWLVFEEIVSWLRKSRLADGLAVMTFEMDPAAETGQQIVTALERAGALAPAE